MNIIKSKTNKIFARATMSEVNKLICSYMPYMVKRA